MWVDGFAATALLAYVGFLGLMFASHHGRIAALEKMESRMDDQFSALRQEISGLRDTTKTGLESTEKLMEAKLETIVAKIDGVRSSMNP